MRRAIRERLSASQTIASCPPGVVAAVRKAAEVMAFRARLIKSMTPVIADNAAPTPSDSRLAASTWY